MLLLCFWARTTAFSYNVDDSNPVVSFSAVNEPMGSVLARLVTDHDLNLTFNASEADFGQKISYTAENKPILTILTELLGLIKYEYTPIGNHLVIHRSARYSDQLPANHATGELLADTIVKYIEVPIIVRDTVVVVERIIETRYRDPAFVTSMRPLIATRQAMSTRQLREDTWSFSVSYGQMLAGYRYTGPLQLSPEQEDIKRAESFSFRNNMLSAGVNYKMNALRINGGISLNSYATPFNYTELFMSGGFFEVDTLDSFYTIVDGEYIWTYITDSVYIPEESREVRNERTNRIGFLEAGLGFSYDIFLQRYVAVYIKGGFHIGIPLWGNAVSVSDQPDYPSVDVDRQQLKQFVMGYQTGIGSRFTLNSRTDFYIAATYKRYLQNIYPDHPLERRLHNVTAEMGLLFYIR